MQQQETTLPKGAKGEERPWGYFVILEDTPTTKVKRLFVKPGERLSYQSHQHRAEHWVVVSGVARVTLDGETRDYKYGEHISIGFGTKHRLACPEGNTPVEIIETQVGKSFDETDIVRYEDDYKRA